MAVFIKVHAKFELITVHLDIPQELEENTLNYRQIL